MTEERAADRLPPEVRKQIGRYMADQERCMPSEREHLERAGFKADEPARPLSEEKLELLVEQRIQERANLGHLYKIEDGSEGPEASFTPRAAASLWRVVQDAVREAGWRIVKNG